MNKSEFPWVWQRSDTSIYENNAHELKGNSQVSSEVAAFKGGKFITSTIPQDLTADAPQPLQKRWHFTLEDIQGKKGLGMFLSKAKVQDSRYLKKQTQYQ